MQLLVESAGACGKWGCGVSGKISKLHLGISDFYRSRNEEWPPCRCGFLELHKELASTSSRATGKFIHSFTPLLTTYLDRLPWPRHCAPFRMLGRQRDLALPSMGLRGCKCPPCLPKGWDTHPPSESSHILMLPPFLLPVKGTRTDQSVGDAVFSTPRRGCIPATGQVQLVFFISTSAPEGQSCQNQSQRVTACTFLQLTV